jgi:hypothetical protein
MRALTRSRPARLWPPPGSHHVVRMSVHPLPLHNHVGPAAWGDIPTWFAAIGTVGALIVAFIQIGTERRLRLDRELKEQARLIAAIAGPALRDEEAQAEADAGGPGWIGGVPAGFARTAIDLINGSSEPVYRLVAGVVFVQGTAPRTMEGFFKDGTHRPLIPPTRPLTTASVLPPNGTYRVWVRGFWLDAAGAGMGGRSAAEVAFTDRAGKHWVRRATGQLEELREDPIDYFGRLGLPAPYDLVTPERVP